MGDDSSLVLGNKTENHYHGSQQRNDSGLRGMVVGALLTAALCGGFALSHFLMQPEKETVERIIDRVFDSDIEMEIIPPQ